MKPSHATSLLVALATIALVATGCCCSAMSIESGGPVKVTHRNSGPRYDIDEVEKTKLTDQTQPPPPPPPPAAAPRPADQGEQDSGAPIGHVAIRRIYLFPMVQRPSDWSAPAPSEPEQQGGEASREHEPMPSMFAKPFWPFLTPARPSPAYHHQEHHHHDQQHRPHLFGADEASRSPTVRGDSDQDKAASGGEREAMQPMGPQQPMFDPIQMMVDLMHQAINGQLGPNLSDLNNDNNNNSNKDDKTANGENVPAESANGDERPQMPGSELAPKRPVSHNETREDIVEIDGKKFLRKTVMNRHVGENIIFMTKRLIFVPLNETNSATTDTVATTTTSSPTTTTTPAAAAAAAAAEESTASSSDASDRVGYNKPTTTTTGKPVVEEAATTATESPAEPKTTVAEEQTASPTTTTTTSTTTASEQQQPTTTTTVGSVEPLAAEPATTPKSTEPWVDRVRWSDVLEKAAERLVEEAKPSKPDSTAAS